MSEAEAKLKRQEYYQKNKERIAAKSLAYRSRPEVKAHEREKLRAYRKANPHKAREWSIKRIGLKRGRLPKGTVAGLLEKQKHHCAICEVHFSVVGYHMDHIVPLSKGGKHEPSNIQLLCPTCNVRKSAKLNWIPNKMASIMVYVNKFDELVAQGKIFIDGAYCRLSERALVKTTNRRIEQGLIIIEGAK